MQDSMIFYKSFFDAINNVDDKDVQLQVYKAIFEFSLLEQEPELQGLAYTLFILIKPQLVANLKRREDGKKGGRPKTIGLENENHRFLEKETNGYENEKPNVNVNVNVNDNVNENVYNRIFDSYNSQSNLIGCKALTKTRLDKLKSLLEIFPEKEIIETIEKANDTPWLIGKNKSNWKADFDWLMDEDNFCKVMDGRYDNMQIKEEKQDIKKGIYDFDALMREEKERNKQRYGI